MDGLFLYDTEIGRIAIGENGGAIALLRLPGEEVPGTVVQHETELLRKAAEQLREYLRGERKMFDLPLAPDGMANHCNPIPIFIPCHRVVGADGSLTGYAGGLECKRTLLDLERRYGAR